MVICLSIFTLGLHFFFFKGCCLIEQQVMSEGRRSATPWVRRYGPVDETAFRRNVLFTPPELPNSALLPSVVTIRLRPTVLFSPTLAAATPPPVWYGLQSLEECAFGQRSSSTIPSQTCRLSKRFRLRPPIPSLSLLLALRPSLLQTRGYSV